MLLVNTTLPLRHDNMQDVPGGVAYLDSSALLGEPFTTFHQRNSLKWDPHFSPAGNAKFARAVMAGLICRQFIHGSADCQTVDARQETAFAYWRAFAQAQSAFTGRFAAFIDFDHFVNFPQIVGGIYPPREFPNAISQRAEVMVARSGSAQFRLKMSRPVPGDLNLVLAFAAGRERMEQTVSVPAGDHEVAADLSTLLAREPAATLIEVSLRCEPGKCAPARLHWMGFPGHH